MIAGLTLAFAILSALPAMAGERSEMPDPEAEISITRNDWPIALKAGIDIPAAPEKVWRTLTDYDHLPDFLLKMKTSRLISRTGHLVVVEQSTETRFLFFKRTIIVTLKILEKPTEEISFYNIAGNMELFSGKWVLTSSGNGQSTRLEYLLDFKPAFFAPGWIVRHTIDHEVPQELQMISKEVQKR